MRFGDLPATVQRQIRKGQAISAEKTTAIHRQSHLPPQPRQRDSWRCHECGLRFTAWQRAQNHANEAGHVRIELLLPGES